MNLADVLKDIEKMSGKGSVMQGVEVKDVPRIPLSMINVNRMLHGGIPKGRIIEFSGAESSGKTTTSLLAIAAYQKQDDRPVFFVDAEGTYDPRWAAKLGVNNSPEKFIKWAPENVTAEEVFEQILKIVETNEIGFIVLDSIPALVPQQEDAKNMTEYQMGGISKPLTIFSKKLSKALLKNDTVTFIGINQVRDNMSQYGNPISTPGGHQWRHMCSIRLTFRGESVDANGNHVSETVENPAGCRINVSLVKDKTSIKNRRLAYYIIDFVTGYNETLDIFNTAVKMGIINQKGAGYSYSNTETGEITSALGKVKFLEKATPETLEKIKEEVNNYDTD